MVRVHAILLDENPSLTGGKVVVKGGSGGKLEKSDINQLRKEAVQLLGDFLGGDLLAAEYLLMMSMERVTARCEGMARCRGTERMESLTERG